ncbi:hypothetical protein LAZ67_6000616 [Cordylochernes scorpioides]|uniref:Mos1 transposase HTH domain-containing protein n=1 Tax=Cordylochernes scorpioides TaxID=51811 RepID=A0ABY6KIS5_9ARAC|nr:hypothetical protein LAZ67_6000616 [Cordylochernes scorpioides]
MIDCIEKQQFCVEFCLKLGKTAFESFQILKQTFKEDALSQSRTFEWFSRFKAGRTSVKDDLHTGRPLSIRNPEKALKIKSSIKENPRITIRELSEDLDLSFRTCQTIIKNNLHLKRSPAKFVSHLLTNDLKEHRKETCKNMVEMFNSDPHWLENVIRRNETWVYGYDPKTKRDGWLRHTSRAFQISVSSQVKFDEICPAPSLILMFVPSCSIMLIPAPPLLRVRSEDPSVYAVEGRGLAILIKNLYYEDIAVNITNTLDLEAQGIKVYLNQNKAIHIYNMYHPPNNTFIDDGTMAQFLTDNTIIVGDLNPKHQLWGCSTPNPRGKILSNIFDDNAFMCLNDGNPTHHSYKL